MQIFIYLFILHIHFCSNIFFPSHICEPKAVSYMCQQNGQNYYRKKNFFPLYHRYQYKHRNYHTNYYTAVFSPKKLQSNFYIHSTCIQTESTLTSTTASHNFFCLLCQVLGKWCLCFFHVQEMDRGKKGYFLSWQKNMGMYLMYCTCSTRGIASDEYYKSNQLMSALSNAHSFTVIESRRLRSLFLFVSSVSWSPSLLSLTAKKIVMKTNQGPIVPST